MLIIAISMNSRLQKWYIFKILTILSCKNCNFEQFLKIKICQRISENCCTRKINIKPFVSYTVISTVNHTAFCQFCLKPFLFFFIAVSAMNEGHFESQLSPIMEESPNRRWETDDNAQECEGLIAGLISFISGILLLVTFPFSLCMCIRMVQVSTLSIIQCSKSKQSFQKYILKTQFLTKLNLSLSASQNCLEENFALLGIGLIQNFSNFEGVQFIKVDFRSLKVGHFSYFNNF